MTLHDWSERENSMSLVRLVRCASSALILIAFALTLPVEVRAQVAPQPGQRTFKSPDAAAAALVAALKSDDSAALAAILGIKSRQALSSGDAVADHNDVAGFIRSYEQMHRFANGPDGKYYLLVGAQNWPMPFPLATRGSQWFFDTAYGEAELHYRRIGRNELAAINVIGEVVKAQNDYFRQTHDGQTHVYAARLISDTGKQNGLYWKAAPGEPPSPIGPLVAAASKEGYRAAGKDHPQQYYGYLYKLLTAQGPDAPGGAKDYMKDGKLSGGFAVLAYPAQYRRSGVATFIAGPDGTIYEKDLGPKTQAVASAITQFDPDKSWRKLGSD